MSSIPPVRMSDHTTGDMGGSHRNVLAHPLPQVHLLVDSMKATGWQPHSVRGFLSGAVGKKMGLAVTSAKEEDGGRTYSVKG
jgi:hypothetical protein